MQDPFTDHVLRNMPPAVRATFSETQQLAIQEALAKARQSARERHLLDIRFSIPLFWARYYIVFLLGRDQRKHVRNVLKRRRISTARLLRGVMAMLIVSCAMLGLLVAILLLLYVVKSWLGVDFFPDRHLRDFLGLRR